MRKVGGFDAFLFELSEDGEPMVHLGTRVGRGVDVFVTEDLQNMEGAPFVFGLGYLLEVFHAVVEDIAVFVVDFLFGVMSLAYPCFVDEDVAVKTAKISHVRICASTFAVITMPPGSTQGGRKYVFNFCQLSIGPLMEPSFVTRAEEFTFSAVSRFGSFAVVQFKVSVLEEDDIGACYGVDEFVRITVVLKAFDFAHDRTSFQSSRRSSMRALIGSS